MSQHISIQIKGRVQGVWFRKSVKDVADNLALVGHVTNNKDGIVTIEACGDTKGLKQLVLWCKDGPEMAVVDDVQYIFDDECGAYNDFKIL